jgi:hypothetical protein
MPVSVVVAIRLAEHLEDGPVLLEGEGIQGMRGLGAKLRTGGGHRDLERAHAADLPPENPWGS